MKRLLFCLAAVTVFETNSPAVGPDDLRYPVAHWHSSSKSPSQGEGSLSVVGSTVIYEELSREVLYGHRG
jgi:hypothetical protein